MNEEADMDDEMAMDEKAGTNKEDNEMKTARQRRNYVKVRLEELNAERLKLMEEKKQLTERLKTFREKAPAAKS